MADIELTAPDGHVFTAHRAERAGPPLGAVVVIQEIFGVNEHIRAVTDRFAADGFVAVAPALFDRVERGAEYGYDEAGMVAGANLAWNELSIDDALTDVAATAAALGAELGGPNRVGVVGYCYGGMLAAATAIRHPEVIGAAVAYYPSLANEKLEGWGEPQRPLMVHLGDQDQRVSVEVGETLAGWWPHATFHRYAEAGHGFNCDLRASYDAAAAALAWQRTHDFFAQHLAG